MIDCAAPRLLACLLACLRIVGFHNFVHQKFIKSRKNNDARFKTNKETNSVLQQHKDPTTSLIYLDRGFVIVLLLWE
jgi:hypothetical protein